MTFLRPNIFLSKKDFNKPIYAELHEEHDGSNEKGSGSQTRVCKILINKNPKHFQTSKVKNPEISAVTHNWRAGHYKSMHPEAKRLPKGGLRGAGAPLVLKTHPQKCQKISSKT